ncbi:AAA family ATPase [Candidatus Bathyarchaeota archaeon]|nr:AAA family ATPase [Candidatus Bathyarchaeota archaeon]
MRHWIPTGSSLLDQALGGGLPPQEACLLYGQAETGKSTLAVQCAVNCARLGLKTLYVDSDGTFTPERLYQIASQDFKDVSDFIIISKPSTFSEQITFFDKLEQFINSRFGLIVVDTITSLYSSEIMNKKEMFNLNRELNRQVAILVEIAKRFDLSILLISQVRNAFSETETVPVATRVLKFWCNSIVSLSRVGPKNLVKTSVEKAGGRETKINFYLVIKEDGLRDYQPLI